MNAFDLIDYLPDSPFRRPEERWLRAQEPHSRGTYEDPWIGSARDAITGIKRSSRLRAILAIQAAQAMWEAPDRRHRWELEARLLARQSTNTIAASMRLSVDVVEAFAAVFFDVRPRIQASDWIFLQAIGGPACTNFASAEQPGAIWKYVGYVGGPIALEAVLAVTKNTPLPAGVLPAAAHAGTCEEARFRIHVKALLQVFTGQSDEAAAKIKQTYLGLAPAQKVGSPAKAGMDLVAFFRSRKTVVPASKTTSSVVGPSPAASQTKRVTPEAEKTKKTLTRRRAKSTKKSRPQKAPGGKSTRKPKASTGTTGPTTRR
jgi:hypothetical protein